jgi:CheY-like chemotaxis protein
VQADKGSELVQEPQQWLPPSPAASASYPWPDLNGIHAVLIDDNRDARTMITEVLTHCGAVVTVYPSADQAVASVVESVPAVFICDLSMPGLDGLQFMRRMRALPPNRGSRIPAIAITAYYEDLAAAAALEAGFDAYMIKPIRLEELARLVEELATSEQFQVFQRKHHFEVIERQEAEAFRSLDRLPRVIIVRRGETKLYQRLRTRFASDAETVVLYDRREEPRRGPQPRQQSARHRRDERRWPQHPDILILRAFYVVRCLRSARVGVTLRSLTVPLAAGKPTTLSLTR